MGVPTKLKALGKPQNCGPRSSMYDTHVFYSFLCSYFEKNIYDLNLKIVKDNKKNNKQHIIHTATQQEGGNF